MLEPGVFLSVFYSHKTLFSHMRSSSIYKIIGQFLQVFAGLLLTPIPVALYYQEPVYIPLIFFLSSLFSLSTGTLLRKLGGTKKITVKEGLIATVIGWVIACVISAIPFLLHLNMLDAFFEASAGLTTTGMSVIETPESLEKSLLFWRGFIQWIGGLGILTFFMAVIRESGEISRKLFSAESHKTDPGTVRPSLTKSILALWKVYISFTALALAVYYTLGASLFDSLVHALTVMPTGGFSTMSESIAGFNSVPIEIATIFFMLAGGTNFVLFYSFVKGNRLAFLKNSEFKLYMKIFAAISLILVFDLIRQTGSPLSTQVVLDAVFQGAAIISSTGYSTMSVVTFSIAAQMLLIGVMFVGGSLGSTAGGFKIFRLKVMYELLKTRIRAYSLPDTAINEVKIDKEILENSAVRTISVIFFVWVLVVFSSTVLIMFIENLPLMEALSGTVSAAGNMGPVFLTEGSLVEYSPFTKIILTITMVAGRLEMLPVLAIFNRQVVKNS